MLVWGFDDTILRQIVSRAGYRVVIFQPKWLPSALAARFPTRPRQTRPINTPEV
jgi:hypothetical protein